MKLSKFKSILNGLDEITFLLPDSKKVPTHFHITEVGKIAKNFIDCGGTVRNEEVVNFQLWSSNDFDHRLQPEKLNQIINLAEGTLGIGDMEIEVEYQGDTIGKYGLDFDGKNFLLTGKKTACLAEDACGIPTTNNEVKELQASQSSCTPGSGCC